MALAVRMQSGWYALISHVQALPRLFTCYYATMSESIEDLPYSVCCDDCDLKHFLTITRDINGAWSAAYLAFDEEQGDVIAGGLFLNHADSLGEVAMRMQRKLAVWQRRHG